MAIVNLDKVAGIHLESVQHTSDMTNGLFFHAGDLVEGEQDLVNVKVPSEASYEEEPILLHASPEVMYDPRKSGLADFVLEAGEAGRAYYLEVGDIVQLTDDLFTAAPTVGEYVVPDGNGSMNLAPSADGTQTIGTATYTPRFKAKVIEQTNLGANNDIAYAIRVEKA